ncbi:MAG: hypothetical protein RSC31_08400 [Anaerovoracaceae bacterium]
MNKLLEIKEFIYNVIYHTPDEILSEEEKNRVKSCGLVHFCEQSKGERKNYDVYIVVKKLSEEQMKKIRIRRKIDYAVIFPGTLKTDNMKAYRLEQ